MTPQQEYHQLKLLIPELQYAGTVHDKPLFFVVYGTHASSWLYISRSDICRPFDRGVLPDTISDTARERLADHGYNGFWSRSKPEIYGFKKGELKDEYDLLNDIII